jgi:hypothetical protein
MPHNEAQEACDENQNQATMEVQTSTSTARTKLMERGTVWERYVLRLLAPATPCCSQWRWMPLRTAAVGNDIHTPLFRPCWPHCGRLIIALPSVLSCAHVCSCRATVQACAYLLTTLTAECTRAAELAAALAWLKGTASVADKSRCKLE